MGIVVLPDARSDEQRYPADLVHFLTAEFSEKPVVAIRIKLGWQLLRHFGPGWLAVRLLHAASIKSGLMQWRLPVTNWDDHPLEKFLTTPALADVERYAEYRTSAAPPFFFESRMSTEFRSALSSWDRGSTTPSTEAEEIGRGLLRFFSNTRVDVGFPPNWHANPMEPGHFPVNQHWSQIGDFAMGDIKLVWEANRFGFVFPLVRSYWRTGSERHAELFWQLVESWQASNAPESGVNWKCGQEISFRVMAWCFGMYGFGTSPSSTPVRVAMLARMIAVSGQRIESNIGYGLSQKNNHGLSEATGLWTIGALFPEFADSARWAATGRRLLEAQARELIYDDGAFSQHSTNYHRVMLHDYLWSIRLGDVLKQPFSPQLRHRIAVAGDFLFQLQDESTGMVPCYGADDGALILPLNNCGYRDFRPVVQATHFLSTGQRRFDAGPWDEDLFWLFGVKPSSSKSKSSDVRRPADSGIGDESEQSSTSLTFHPPERPLAATKIPAEKVGLAPCRPGACPTFSSRPLFSRTDFEATVGGYATLRSPNGFAMVRSAAFRHRPSQADILHVDVWWRGENIAIDPGTYSYNAPAPWNNSLARTAHHNTVTVDGLDQMEQAGRFLWLPWLKGTSFAHATPCHGDASCWNGEHDGYRRLSDPVTHRRGLVRLGADHWLVVDALCGMKSHPYRLHWLLRDALFDADNDQGTIKLQTSVGEWSLAVASSEPESTFDVVRADADSPRGWRSRYYHSREPALSISLVATARSVVFATLLGPRSQTPIIQGDRVFVQGSDWIATVSLNRIEIDGVPLISSIITGGQLANVPSVAVDDSLMPQSELLQCTSC